MRLLENNARGTYNLVNSGDCNRLEFVGEIFDIMQYDKSRIELMAHPPSSWLAKRPENSPLSTGKYRRLTGRSPRTWQEALRDFLERDTR
jgi:dTDP-4-dehydrorhamnose reductase